MSYENQTTLGLSEEILAVLKKTPEGVTQGELISTIPLKETEIVACLNILIESNRISVIDGTEGMIFKYRSEKDALKFRELQKDDISVYEIIIQSGGNGISTGDLKAKMRIESSAFINRILKRLEKKFLIKSLKVLNTKNKKVWIGYDIEPSQEITGGLWCSNQEIDSNLISVFSDKCFDYISSQNSISRKEILLYARCANILDREMKEDDIQKLLNILVFDGKIEAIFPDIPMPTLNKHSILISKNDTILALIKYRKNRVYKPKAIFDSIPCSLCKVFNECNTKNVVNPIECCHMKNFIQFS